MAQETLTGEQPESCQTYESFASYATTKTKTGSPPTLDMLEAWLKPYAP